MAQTGAVSLISMILRFLFYAFLLYLAYKLVFHFIIPVYRTTRKLKRGFREMQERMQQHAGPSAHQQPQQDPAHDRKKTGAGDYIEFEEIK